MFLKQLYILEIWFSIEPFFEMIKSLQDMNVLK